MYMMSRALTPRHGPLQIAIALLFICLHQHAALAQSGANDAITVDVELSRSSVYVGDELAYQVIVRGARNPEPPEVEFPDLVQAQFHGRSSQSFTSMQIINGVRRSVTERSYIFQYTLTAMKEGLVEIPAPSVMADGQRVMGEPTSFDSLLPVQSDQDVLELRLDRSQLYLNETVEVECVWWIAPNTSEFNLASSHIPDSFEVRASPSQSGGQYKVDFSLSGQSMSGFVDTDTRNGREMSRFTFRFTITPTQLGSFELGPMRSIFTRHTGSGNRFRAYVESNTIPVEVIEVPSEGRPEYYSGAIGAYQLTARASNTNINVGDPIKLTLRVQGDEPMVGINDAPDLTQRPAFSDRFKIDSEGWREVSPRKPAMRLYEITIRALDESVSEIPPIELPSFIPETGRFTVFETDPIPLSVTGVREVTLADALVNSRDSTPRQSPSERVDRIELTTAAPGLWAHATPEDILNNPGFNLAQTLTRPGWQVALATPPGVFCLAWIAASYIRSRNPDRVRLCRAYASARRHEGAQALKAYIAHTQSIDPNAVTASDARGLPIDPDLLARVYTLILETESGAQPGPSANQNASGLLRAVHTQCLAQLREAAA